MTYEEFTQRYTYNPSLDRIGNGKFGTFYKAYDNLLHREVTIKKVLTEANSFYPEAYYWSDFVFTINLKDEYEVLKRIPKHKNIAYYDEHYSFDGYEYAILPYQVETDLCDLMQQNLTMEQKESIALQLLDGLDFLHKHQIYGCFDPWNVLMIKTRDGFAPIITNLGVKPQVVNMSCEAFGLPRFINHQFYSYLCEHSDVEMYVIILYELFTGRILSKDAENKIDYSCSEPERAFAAKGLRELIERISDPWKEIISSFFSLVGGLNTQDIFDVINTYNSPELEVIEADVIQPDKNHPNAINGYTLQYQLGEGGMAEVWYAENKIGKKAAVKMLSPKFCGDGVIVARFENEARVMVRLEHPNIRQVYDYATVDGRPCIIMEYLEGNDLKSMMKLGYHFSDDELVKWWNQMAQALNYTHKMGVVHRDIKPSNIFIDNQGNVKLLDFGIAKNDDNAANTLTGSTMGTLLYMSPEQVKDPKQVTFKTDLYSLAVTFVHLISGRAPYDSTNSSNFEIQMNIVRKPLDISGLPQMWRAFLEPYLDKDSKNRPELTEFDGEKYGKPRKYPVFVDPSDPNENSNPHIPIEETVFDDVSYLHFSLSVTDSMSFQEAFEVARREIGVGGLFEWHGHICNTYNPDEWNTLSEKAKDGFWAAVHRTTTSLNPQASIERNGNDLVFTINGVSFVMKKVESGTFQMGATPEQGSDVSEDEKPVHTVKLSNYYMAETPVTQALWRAVMGQEAECEFKGADLPVDSVFQGEQLFDFLFKLYKKTEKMFRLPTEAEWEFAARGGNRSKGYKYAGSDDLSRVAWSEDNSGNKTHPVKQKMPNELGIYDMCGNVVEWCSDVYGKYDSAFQENPRGPLSDRAYDNYVARGGCWDFRDSACRVSFRFDTCITVKPCWFGLRLALSCE